MKDDYVKIQIHPDFDWSQPEIGYVMIKKEYADKFPLYSLSPGFIKKELDKTELVHFGLITSENYIKSFNKDNSIIDLY